MNTLFINHYSITIKDQNISHIFQIFHFLKFALLEFAHSAHANIDIPTKGRETDRRMQH
jgi:hypothetical protein